MVFGEEGVGNTIREGGVWIALHDDGVKVYSTLGEFGNDALECRAGGAVAAVK